MNNDRSLTEAWRRVELGRAYNRSLTPDRYSLVSTNNDFFSGNQWSHLPESAAASKLPRPTFNIIKRVASLFVASLTSSAVSVSFEPLAYYDGRDLSDPDSDASVCATAEVRNLLEKFKIDCKIRDALFDGARTGDYCAHFFWNPEALPYGGAYSGARGEIEMELVDGINVMFGNPNTPEVEKQPYVLLLGRDTVENLRRECAFYNGEEAAEKIMPDSGRDLPFTSAPGDADGDDAKTGKALYVYMYTKEPRLTETGEKEYTVRVTKATRDCNIFSDVDTGLTRYPVAWGNWEREKDSYHGRALVTGIVPNQIFINSMMAMVFRHLQLQSFPRTVYNADLIPNWSNELGAALAVRNLQPGQSLDSAVMNLAPADMSGQIIQAIDKVFSYTKECLGATDAQMGSVKPENTSALMVLQSSAEVPLENTRAGLYSWLEDVAAILLDMMGTYYGRRPLLRERSFTVPVTDASGTPVLNAVTGQMETRSEKRRVLEDYDFSALRKLWLNVSVDVGASTYYSEIAAVQTLDNLRADGTLDVIDYLERVPERLVPRKRELIDTLRERAARAAENPQPQSGKSPAPGASALQSGVANLPGGIQSRYSTLPASARRALTGSV